MESLRPGLRHEATVKVAAGMLVPNVSIHLPAFSDMPPVFVTAMMIGFIEATCIECLRGHLDPGEHTVGTHVNVSHLAATPKGMTVRAVVELVSIDGKRLNFNVEAFDENGLIGKGSHHRTVIDIERFRRRYANAS